MSGLKLQRRAAGSAQRSRQTQARPSSSSTSFSRSRCPLWGSTYLSFSDIVGPSYNRSQPVLLLILSAWKWNSANFVMTFSEVHQESFKKSLICGMRRVGSICYLDCVVEV